MDVNGLWVLEEVKKTRAGWKLDRENCVDMDAICQGDTHWKENAAPAPSRKQGAQLS